MRPKKYRKIRIMRNEKGFTLAEVMVSFVILLLASQLLLVGTAVAGKMEKKANEYSIAGDLLEDAMKDKSRCVSGTLRLKLDRETELSGDGWLYRYKNGTFKIEGIRLDDMSEYPMESGKVSAEETK